MWEEKSQRKYTGFTTCDALPYTVLSPKATEGINVSSGLVFARGVLKATSEPHTLWSASAKNSGFLQSVGETITSRENRAQFRLTVQPNRFIKLSDSFNNISNISIQLCTILAIA
jgi:hypothetical protein